jgi:hypothetical protein
VSRYREALEARNVQRAIEEWWGDLVESHTRLQGARVGVGEGRGPELHPLEDLRAFLRHRRRELRALVDPDLEDPSIDIAWVILRAASEDGLDVARLDDALERCADDEAESREHLQASLALIFHELRRRLELSPPAAWAYLREQTEREIAVLRRDVSRLSAAQKQVAALAALPSAQELDLLIRYETAIARDFDRTLQQFKQRRLIRDGIDQADST